MSINQHYSFHKFAMHYVNEDDAWLVSCDEKRLCHEVEEQVKRCMSHASQYFKNLPQPEVWCDLRGKSAGQAHFGRPGLRFNPVLLGQNPRTFLNQVVPHEVAHWVVHYGISARLAPHGPEWRYVMTNLFGLPAEVTHRFDVSTASPSPYVYQCHCMDDCQQPILHYLGIRRHHSVLKGRRYLCRRCKGELRYVGEV